MKKYVFLGIGVFVCICFAFIFFVDADSFYTERGGNGIVSLNFDDGVESQYTVAFKEMNKRNIPGTIFLITHLEGLFESRRLVSVGDALIMQSRGREIGSHSKSHHALSTLSSEYLLNELEDSKIFLENSGFKVTTLAYPFGKFDEEVSVVSKKFYSVVRPLEWGTNSKDSLDFYNLVSKWVRSETSSKEVCSWIRDANRRGEWLILVFHHIGKEETSWDFCPKKFSEVLDCIEKEKIRVATMQEIFYEVNSR